MNVTLCGVDYPVRFSVNALCCLEEKTGKSLAHLQSLDMICLRGLLWCGLMEGKNAPSLEETGDMITRHLQGGGSMETLAHQLAAALEDACFFPQAGRSHPPSPCGSNTGI